MDWVHCNTCFGQPGASGKKFFLTSCGHVFCQDCIQVSASQTCNVCKSPCTFIPLTSNLKPDVEIFFMDPADLLKKQQKQYLQVLEFQKSHRKRLVSHFQKGSANGTNSGQTNRKWQEMERELKKLVEENIMLKKMITGMNGDPKSRGSSSSALAVHRPGTPQYRGISPGVGVQNALHQRGHYSSSVHGQTSPYSRSAPVTPQMINSMKASQRDTPKTPAGPIRLTIRTPPSNGMLGRIGTPPSGRLRSTPGIVANLLRAGNTPGAKEAQIPTNMRASLTDSQMAHGNSPTRRLSQLSDSNSNSSQRMAWSSAQQTNNTSRDRNTPARQQTASSQSSSRITPNKQHYQHQTGSAGNTVRKQGISVVDVSRRQIQLNYQPHQPGH